MKDCLGRTIDYMRVSITDRCNLRCRYCMPDGCEWIPMEQILTFEEITEVCRLAAQLGIRHIKITGGEPLVRKGCADLIGMLKSVSGIEQVTLTTNGVLLAQHADALCSSGLDAVNVSLDTLNAQRYEKITGFPMLEHTLRGIDAVEQRIPLKINTVLQRGINADEWRALAELAKDRNIAVRFIEMMPIGHGKEYRSISNQWILKQMNAVYGTMTRETARHGNGPAVYYHIEGFMGSIGFISAVHGKFCTQCNRIRMTAVGQLKPCLCYSESFSIREALRSGNTDDVKRMLCQTIERKPAGHCFEEEKSITEMQEMSKIGG